MTALKKILLAALLAALLLLSGFVLGRRSAHAPEPAESIRTDTLRIRDTLLVEKPVPVEVRVTDTMLVAAADTVQVMVRDTVQVMVQVPREVRVYSDSAYRAQVSGYRPSLDWVEVYPQTVVVTKIISADSRKRWGIGVQAGYGAYAAGGRVMLAPYVGVGVSWDIVSW